MGSCMEEKSYQKSYAIKCDGKNGKIQLAKKW